MLCKMCKTFLTLVCVPNIQFFISLAIYSDLALKRTKISSEMDKLYCLTSCPTQLHQTLVNLPRKETYKSFYHLYFFKYRGSPDVFLLSCNRSELVLSSSFYRMGNWSQRMAGKGIQSQNFYSSYHITQPSPLILWDSSPTILAVNTISLGSLFLAAPITSTQALWF